MWGAKETLVTESTRESKGTVWRAVNLTKGCLSVGVSRRDDLLRTIEDRFSTTRELERFLEEHGLPGTSWNRIGD